MCMYECICLYIYMRVCMYTLHLHIYDHVCITHTHTHTHTLTHFPQVTRRDDVGLERLDPRSPDAIMTQNVANARQGSKGGMPSVCVYV
jgi:hypothetical protein